MGSYATSANRYTLAYFFEQDTLYYSREHRGARPSYAWACYMGHRHHSHSAACARAHAHACRLCTGLREQPTHECGARRFSHPAFAALAIERMITLFAPPARKSVPSRLTEFENDKMLLFKRIWARIMNLFRSEWFRKVKDKNKEMTRERTRTSWIFNIPEY